MGRRAILCLLLASACEERIIWPEPDLSWMEAPTCPPATGPRVMVTNSLDDTISWIDVATLTVVCQEPVGLLPPEREGPHHGAALSDGSAFFVGLSNAVPGSGSGPHGSHGTGDVRGYLLKYDGRSHELVGRKLVDRNPGDVRLTPDETYILQSHYDLQRVLDFLMPMGDASAASPSSRLAVIDPRTMQDVAFVEICPTSHGIGVSADSSRAFVTCSVTDELAVVTLTEPWAVTILPVLEGTTTLGSPRKDPYAVAVDPDSGDVWVSSAHRESEDVRVFDDAALDGAPIVISTTPGAPFFGDFWQGFYVVPLQGSDSIAFIDRTTKAIDGTLTLEGCQAPHAVLKVDDQRLFVVCEGNRTDPGSVVIVDPNSRAVVGEPLTVGVFPDDLVLVPPPR